jgi:hypothetical protein
MFLQQEQAHTHTHYVYYEDVLNRNMSINSLRWQRLTVNLLCWHVYICWLNITDSTQSCGERTVAQNPPNVAKFHIFKQPPRIATNTRNGVQQDAVFFSSAVECKLFHVQSSKIFYARHASSFTR